MEGIGVGDGFFATFVLNRMRDLLVIPANNTAGSFWKPSFNIG